MAESPSSDEVFLRPVPWPAWLFFCVVTGAAAGFLDLGREVESLWGIMIFAAVGGTLLTPWHVRQHRLLSRAGDRQDLKTRIIRGGTVLGVAARNGLAGWILGSIVSLLLWLWVGLGATLWARLGLGLALAVTLGALYRFLPAGVEDRSDGKERGYSGFQAEK